MAEQIPVYSVWQPEVGPALSLGMILASARIHDGGRLNERFELRPVELAESFIEDLASREGPAVLLASDYLWSTTFNLETARRGREVNSDLIVIHGGPDAPKYPTDAEQFLRENSEVAHVLVRGEGEYALPEVLGALADADFEVSAATLANVEGIAFLDGDGQIHRTEDRERISDLNELPSPYLSGEFDHLDPDVFILRTFFLETNRGCPYGCVFCDWGSATMARIRKFSPDRVLAECEWAQSRGFEAIFLCDANFGILPQDVEIAQRLGELRNRTGFPSGMGMALAKKSTKRVLRVVDTLMSNGIGVSSCISLQSIDPDTVEASRRDNIPIGTYLDVAAVLRRRGYGLQGEVILGLPGQTYGAYQNDVQFMFDHEITTRTWPLRVLVNSPMNDLEFRTEYQIVADEEGLVRSTAAMSEVEISRALRLRTIDEIVERYGLLRHLLRFLQWDHGLRAVDIEEALLDMTITRSQEYPFLSWTLTHFDVFTTPASGRLTLFEDVRRFLVSEFHVQETSDFKCVLEMQRELTPAAGRSLPSTINLEHDYVAYYLAATRSLYETGRAGRPDRPLRDYGQSSMTIEADPFDVCRRGTFLGADAKTTVGSTRQRVLEDDFHVGSSSTNELLSPLVRILPAMAAMGPSVMKERLSVLGLDAEVLDRTALGDVDPDPGEPAPVEIRLGSTTQAI